MPSFIDNVKKILCCNGFAILKRALLGSTKAALANAFISAAQAFVTQAENELGETIPFPTHNDTDQDLLAAFGTVSDAMGRLVFAEVLPAQSYIDDLTDAAEAIANDG